MKKLFFVLLILTFVFGNAFAQSALIDVNIPRYEPYPAQPGKYLDVWIKVENIGRSDASNVIVTVDAKFPFSLDPSETAVKELGTIKAGQYELVKYKLIVSENAVQGENYINIKYRYGGYEEITKKVAVTVETHDAILSINKITIEPKLFVPGKSTKVNLLLENMDDTFLVDISVRLNIENTTLPFAPADSVSEKRIYQIAARKTQSLEFDIFTMPNAEAGIYKIPVEIKYVDSVGNSYVKTDIISFIVGDRPKLDVILDKNEIRTSGSSGKVSIILINKGLINLKFLKLKLLPSDNYKILSVPEQYIGDLDSDDTDNVEYTIYVKKGIKNFNLSFEVEYLDANNNEFKENIDVPIYLFSATELRTFENKGSGIGTIVILILIIGAAGYLFYKKILKKRR